MDQRAIKMAMARRMAGRPMGRPGFKDGGSMPDLTGDGKITRADVLKGRGVFKKGGVMKESKSMMKKEVSFMKKKGAPKSMLKHEMKEAGMKKMAGGGMTGSFRRAADGIASKGKTKGKMVKMAYGGKC